MKRVTFVLAAASAVGAFAATGWASTTPVTADKSTVVASSDNDIRGAVSDLTCDALTKADMHQLTSRFAQADQKRIMASSSYEQNYGSKLDSQIDQLNKDWKQKYGHDFEFSRLSGALGSEFATIRTGTAGHDAQLQSFVMKNATGATEKLATGEQIAEMDIKSSGKGAEIRVPLVRETGANKAEQWHVQIPDSLTATQLRSNLESQLSAFSDKSAQWSKDEGQAYRDVAQHVLKAVLDESAPAKAHAAAQPVKSNTAAASANTATSTSYWWQFWRGW